MAKEKKKAQALPEAEDSAPAPKKSRKKRILIILIVIIFMLTGVGAGGYWWFFIHKPGEPIFSSKKAPEESEAAQQQAVEEKGATPKKGAEAQDQQGRIEAARELPRSRGVVVPLPLITVNIFEGGGHRYLKLGMEVEASRDITKAVKENEARIRDSIIMLLAGKSYKEVASPDGKVMLKVEVANRLNQILGEQRVIRVYFTDFVVQ
ncbi:MAG: flagellar basal body-associated FliL family protein [Desulfovibrio sp.]|nr:flagellar basal body-associated FliL family protein [Desulfovibrio sp.]